MTHHQVVSGKQDRFTGGNGQDQYLTFTLGGEYYGIGILYIKEIIEYGQLTSVPIVSPVIRGVLNLRGNVLPVIDLAVRLNASVASEADKYTCIIIVELKNKHEHVEMGIIVDAVNDVVSLSLQDLEPPPSFGSYIRPDFIKNIGRVSDQFITLLDTERVLSIDELSTMES